jgi:6-phosphofructokinase 1
MPAWAVRAGAREKIFFDPKQVTAAIVTCGGLCPGLNDVVQGIVKKLEDYGVPEGNILGIRYAFLRCVWHTEAEWLQLLGLLVTRCSDDTRGSILVVR